MAHFALSASAPQRTDALGLKSNLVTALNIALQIQRETLEMTEAQIQTQYGFSGSQAVWQTTINGIVTALQAAAVTNYISKLGPA